MKNPSLFGPKVIGPLTLDFSTTKCNSNQMYVVPGLQFCSHFNISASTCIIFLSVPLVCFVHVCVCVFMWRKARWRVGQSFTMVNWKEPFFYSAINPIWVNKTLLCSWAVAVIYMPSPKPESTSNSTRSPERWQDAAETGFHKVYNAKYCVSLYSFREAGDTLETEWRMERVGAGGRELKH